MNCNWCVSGLDDTMRTAYQAISEEWHRRDDVADLRTAAFIVSITRVADSLPRHKGCKPGSEARPAA